MVKPLAPGGIQAWLSCWIWAWIIVWMYCVCPWFSSMDLERAGEGLSEISGAPALSWGGSPPRDEENRLGGSSQLL